MGDFILSSVAQSQLVGSQIAAGPLELAYGASLQLKNAGIGGQLLLSADAFYQTGSYQQAVLCDGYFTSGADFKVDWAIGGSGTGKGPHFVQNGSVIRLGKVVELVGTNRQLMRRANRFA